MAWVTPKTNWVSTDFVNRSDINRITGNLSSLKDLILELFNYSVDYNPTEQTVTDYPFASLLNEIESILEEINEHTYNFDIGETQTYIANGHPFDYNELNRIESATLKIKLTLNAQKDCLRHLSFRLGTDRTFDVPRV